MHAYIIYIYIMYTACSTELLGGNLVHPLKPSPAHAHARSIVEIHTSMYALYVHEFTHKSKYLQHASPSMRNLICESFEYIHIYINRYTNRGMQLPAGEGTRVHLHIYGKPHLHKV